MSTYYYLPTRNVFGAGSVSEVGALMDSLGGKRTMIVTDSFLATHPMTTQIQDILKQSGIESAVFGGGTQPQGHQCGGRSRLLSGA